MSEMVERMAEAAFLEFSGADPTAEYAWWYGKDEGKPYDWRAEADRTSVGADGFLRCAKAALAAMREPTEKMLMAAQREFSEDNSEAAIRDAWRAAINEALK